MLFCPFMSKCCNWIGASRLAVATELEMEFSEDEGKTFSAHLGRYPIVGTLLDGPATDLAYAGDEVGSQAILFAVWPRRVVLL